MKIASYQIGMNSERVFKESIFQAKTTKLPKDARNRNLLNQQALQLIGQQKPTSNEFQSMNLSLSKKDRLRLDIINLLFPKLFKGKKLNLQIPEQIVASNQIQTPKYITYENYTQTYQYEEIAFSAGGIIKTEDGKEIHFSVELNMTRELYQETYTSVTQQQFVDPLVVNFNGTATELSDTTFHFDLTGNGTMEEIPFLYPGSGFLALDKNGDNIINNGLELFGPQSGNGFNDLSQYDEDKNGWIDENDAVFNHLRIWTKDEHGNDQLFAITEKGIGAIFLGHLPTEFSIMSNKEEEQAKVRSNGIFLFENGQSGTIQHLDFKV